MISLGQAHETALTLENAGATSEFWTRVAQNLELAKSVVALVMNTVFRLVANLDRDMEGWTCVEPVQSNEGEFEPVLHEFLVGDEKCVLGEEMLSRAKKQEVSSGIRHLEAMLRQQEKISVEWRKFALVSTEVWQYPSGNRHVWYLYWNDSRWYLNYYWLDNYFYRNDRLVSPRKYQKSLDA